MTSLGGDSRNRLGLLWLPDAPETQSLISCSGDDSLAVGAEAHVQDTSLVTHHLTDLDQAGVLPNAELILSKSVTGDELFVLSGPLDGAHLTLGVNLVHANTSLCVPEANGAITSTTAGGQQVRLPRAPRQGLHGGAVFSESELGGLLVHLPNVEQVVVAARSELSAVVTPLETADLLGVSSPGRQVRRSLTNIEVHDAAVATASGEHERVPSECTDTGLVALEGTDLLALSNVPQLNLAAICANCCRKKV